MSSTLTLTPEQSKLLRELDEALTKFGRSSAFHGLGDNHRAVGVKFRELETMFPKEAALVTEYYDSENPPQESWAKKAGCNAALFEVLISLRAFYDAEGFTRVTKSYTRLCNDLYTLSSLSPDYNAERGYWKS